MLDEDQIRRLRGAKLLANAEEVGQIEEVYAHSSDNRPALVAVQARGKRVLVPLPVPESDITDGSVRVPFEADTVASAPEASGDSVAAETFESVYAHFGISDATMREDTGLGGTGRANQGMSAD